MEYRKSLLQAEITLKQYRLDLLRFNIFLYEKGISDVSQIATAVILQYIQERMARFTQPTIRHALTSIRQFLFYLHETGRTEVNLSLVAFAARLFRRSPRSIPAQSRAVGRHGSLRTPEGKRLYHDSYCWLGLRSSDICQLQFSELIWKQNRILLKQKRKPGAQIELPLLSDVSGHYYSLKYMGVLSPRLPYVFKVPPYDGVTGQHLQTQCAEDHYARRKPNGPMHYGRI